MELSCASRACVGSLLLGGILWTRKAAEPSKWFVEVIEEALTKGTVDRSSTLGREAVVLAKAGKSAEAAKRLKQAAVTELAAGNGQAQKQRRSNSSREPAF